MVPQVPWWFLDSWNRFSQVHYPERGHQAIPLHRMGKKKNPMAVSEPGFHCFEGYGTWAKRKRCAGLASCFFWSQRCFLLKGGWLRGDWNDLTKNNQQVVLKVASFCELKPCVTKHPKKFDHFPSRVGSSPSPPGMFEYIFEDTLQLQIDMGHLFFFSACLDDDSSGFVLFLVCFVSSESSATIHASRISGFLVFTAVPLSLCHVKATLYTVNRWSQACLQNWKPPVSPNFGATYPGPILAAVDPLCVSPRCSNSPWPYVGWGAQLNKLLQLQWQARPRPQF